MSPPNEEVTHINPLDVKTNDPELEKDNWVLSAGHYENGKIVCIVPTLDTYDQDNL